MTNEQTLTNLTINLGGGVATLASYPAPAVTNYLDRRTSRYPVDPGHLVVALDTSMTRDADGLSEVYSEGDWVDASSRAPRTIVDLRRVLGQVVIKFAQPVDGIGDPGLDPATAELTYTLLVTDPIQLLRQEAGWRTHQGREQLDLGIRIQIVSAVESALTNNLLVWSAPDFQDVARQVFERLSAVLAGWGISLDTQRGQSGAYLAVRRYPVDLSKVVFEFRAAETMLLGEGYGFARAPRLDAYQQNAIETYSRQYGPGAGILDYLKRNRAAAGEFSAWLRAERMEFASRFIETVMSPDLDAAPDRREFAIRVVQAGCRAPLLWA